MGKTEQARREEERGWAEDKKKISILPGVMGL